MGYRYEERGARRREADDMPNLPSRKGIRKWASFQPRRRAHHPDIPSEERKKL